MAAVFHDRVLKSLEDAGLQEALDGNAEKRLKARQQAVASLPEELSQLRARAHAVRAKTIANLEEYQDRFVANVRKNGVEVHRAASSSEAVKSVIDIARQSNSKLIAKAKTMVGEEIELNHALEAAGFEVVETDLGEFIVQLRGEHPTHIITPAVHLRRSDCARTFEEKLGMPYTEDIPVMTATARRALRKTFLSADIGISGVNFGVVETGSLCLFTNEGNGRMVTTLPPIHIALMGLERMVPTLADLELMMSLLPRSATGQKLTVYTSLIHSPRRDGELDGPRERHLVLVDNGRSALLGSPLEEILYCIRCGACLNACPVFREIGGHGYIGVHGEITPYPGPIGSVISPGLFGQSEFGHLARVSSLCGACKEACPVDIDLPKLLLRVRAGNVLSPGAVHATNNQQDKPDSTGVAARQEQPQHVSPGLSLSLRLFTWAAISPSRFSFAQRLGGFFGRLAAFRSPWLSMPARTGWGYSRDLPRPSSTPFHSRFHKISQERHDPPPIEGGVFDDSLTPATPLPAGKGLEIDLVEKFTSELVALGGSVTACKSAQLPGLLLEFLGSRSIDAIQAWNGSSLPTGLLARLAESGITIVSSPDPDIRAGLTAALAGVADTGSLVLNSSPTQPMTASLLPRIHLAVLESASIYASVREIFAEGSQVRSEVVNASATVFVTGPSRTADIEMTLTIGVHGPAEVHVFVID